MRAKIGVRPSDKPPAPSPELELPVARRPRLPASRLGSAARRASVVPKVPSIPTAGGGLPAFRVPLKTKGLPPVAAPDSPEPPPVPAEPPPVPVLPVPPAPPLPSLEEPPPAIEEPIPEADAPPAPVTTLAPEAPRPVVQLVPGRPLEPKPPPSEPAPPPKKKPAPRPPVTPPPAPAMPQQAVPLPSRPPARSIPIPGAPQAAPKSRKGSRPPLPIRPPGLPVSGRGRRGEAAPRERGGAVTKGPVFLPGQPIVRRPPTPAVRMPGTPAPTPGVPLGGFGPRPAPGPGGLRPGGPGRFPGSAPGRPPGPGRGAPGSRRPRPPQQRKRDLEALAESKLQQRKRKIETPKAANTEIFASDGMTVKELAEKLGLKASQIIKALMDKGQRVAINQPLELENTKEIAAHFGATATELSFEDEAILDIDQEEAVEDIETRPPVITVMGHVDHGKTSLLDAIRSANVAAREAGGITQAIGAYHVAKDGKRIVFIDTPGHEAFTKMRAHGASVTDVVVLVVASDDGVMPQTIEAVDHAKAAKVPIIVAVNKIDLPKANSDRVMQQLADRGLVPEAWGGDTIFCPVSAKTQEGIDHLLDTINLVSEMRELKANPARTAIGVVLEAKLDRGKGPVATVLTQNGTLRVGDTFVVGAVLGKVRALMDDRGKQVKEAGPSSAVVVLGLDDLPEPGDQLSVVADTDRAKKIVEYREEKARQQAMAATARLSLEQFQEQLAAGRIKELPIILKADLQGSATVLRDTLAKLTSDKVKVRVIHSGVGAIKESDVLLAITANAVVVGFNVRPERSATALADNEKIDIRLHTVIYELVEELKQAMSGLLEPIRKEEFLGRAQVLEVFHITNVGTVAGCTVDEGVAFSDASARLLRDNVVVHTGRLDSLRRFKDTVKEVRAGQECGLHLERYNDVKKGDEVEFFKVVEIKQDINELIPV